MTPCTKMLIRKISLSLVYRLRKCHQKLKICCHLLTHKFPFKKKCDQKWFWSLKTNCKLGKSRFLTILFIVFKWFLDIFRKSPLGPEGGMDWHLKTPWLCNNTSHYFGYPINIFFLYRMWGRLLEENERVWTLLLVKFLFAVTPIFILMLFNQRGRLYWEVVSSCYQTSGITHTKECRMFYNV